MKSIADQIVVMGERFAEIDYEMVILLARRERFSSHLAVLKAKKGIPIVRVDVEKKRMAQVVRWAKKAGIKDVDFIKGIYRQFFNESIRIQAERHQVLKRMRQR